MQSDGIYTKHGLNPLNKVEMTQGNIDNMIILNNIAVQQPTFPTFTEEPQQEIEKDAALSRHQINESHPQSEMSLNVQSKYLNIKELFGFKDVGIEQSR